VSVAAGATVANFTATAGTVTANQTVTVTAALNGSSKTAAVTVNAMPVTVSALLLRAHYGGIGRDFRLYRDPVATGAHWGDRNSTLHE